MDEPELFRSRRFRVVETRDISGEPRQVIRHPGAVTIIPLVEPGRVCLIRNTRVAVGRTLLELPAGTLEPNEEPSATAARELTEETGYVAGRLDELHSFFLSPGILDERMHLFVAHELVAGPPRREPAEQIENHVVGWPEVEMLIQRGEIEDAKTLVGLFWFLRYGR